MNHIYHLSESFVSNSYSVTDHRLEENEPGRVIITFLYAVLFIRYWFSTFWGKAILYRQLSDQFSKLYFKTIGVDKDCIRSFGKSVSNDTGRVFDDRRGLPAGVSVLGDNITSLFWALVFASAANSHATAMVAPELAGKLMTENITEADDPPRGHTYGHSDNSIKNCGLVVQGKLLVDGPSRSPSKQTRAGLYEKGDYNQ